MSKKIVLRGITEEEYEKAEEIILPRFEEDEKESEIKKALIDGGVPFDKIKRLYEGILINNGLMVNPREVLKNIKIHAKTLNIIEAIEGLETDPVWADVEPFVRSIVQNVEGATELKAVYAVKTVLIDAGYQMPKRPAGS